MRTTCAHRWCAQPCVWTVRTHRAHATAGVLPHRGVRPLGRSRKQNPEEETEPDPHPTWRSTSPAEAGEVRTERERQSERYWMVL